MAEQKDYSSIGPLNAAAQKDGLPLVGMLLLAMLVTFVAVFIAGTIANLL